MTKIVIDPERCKACGLCLDVCPKGLLSIGDKLNRQGARYTVQSRPEQCIGCRLCAIMCPDLAILVYREEASAS